MAEEGQHKKSSLFGDVARIASGTAVAQIVTILISPIVTRLYSSDAFGILSFYLSIVGIVSVNSTLRYHLAIMLPEKNEDASSLVGLSIISSAITCLLIGIGIFFMSDYLENWFKVSVNTTIYFIIPIAIFLDACLLIMRQWHIRMKSFSAAATGDASQSLGASSGQLGFGFLGLVEGIHMVYSSVLGLVASFFVYISTLPHKTVLFSANLIDFARMKRLAIIHKKFPLYSTLAGIINKFAWELPSFMLLGFFNSSILGFYFLGHRLLRMPVSLIGASIGEVYFERGAKAYQHGTLGEITQLVQKRLVQVGFFPFFVLTFVGQDVFIAFFGEEWGMAGLYSQILALWTFVWFLSSPNSTIYSITNNQDKMFNIQVLLFVLRFVGLGIGGLMGSPILAITLLAVAGLLGYGFLLTSISKIAGVSAFFMVKQIFYLWKPCLLFSVVICPALFFGLGVWLLTALAIISILVYYIYIFWKEPELRTMLRKVA